MDPVCPPFAVSEFPPGPKKPTVLIADDEPAVRSGIARLLARDGYPSVEAWSAATTLETVASGVASLVLLDLALGADDGFAVLQQLAPLAPDLSVVILTGRDDPHVMDRAFAGGASGYLTKPVRDVDLRAAVLAALASRHCQRCALLEHGALQHRAASAEAVLAVVEGHFARRLLLTSWFHDTETGAHCARMSAYSQVLATAVGVPETRAKMIGLAATLHDVGKVGVPETILRKPERLTAEEFQRVKEHTTMGARILAGTDVPLLRLAAEIALSHHERWDGSGYPEGRIGDKSPREARIVGLADVYDALSHKRVYKPEWPEAEVLQYFAAKRGTQFEPAIVDAFLAAADKMRDIRQSMPDDPIGAAARGDPTA